MDLLNALRVKLEDLSSGELRPVTVAVVDSGVDATHPDLRGRVDAAYRIETGEDGKPFAVEGQVPGNADVYGHGTAVASIICDIAPNARIIDIRVLDESNVGSGLALLKGFEFAIDQGIRVINMSLAATAKFAPQLNKYCEKAYLHNQLVVAAKRNMPLVDMGFPAEFSSCVSVDLAQMDSPFSVRYRPGHPIEFVAHGEDVTVAAAGGGYTTMTGTSFATPAISGMCTLLVGANEDIHQFEVKSLLRSFAV